MSNDKIGWKLSGWDMNIKNVATLSLPSLAHPPPPTLMVHFFYFLIITLKF